MINPIKMKVIKIGTYRMGSRNIDIFGDQVKDGGAFEMAPRGERNAQVFVGLNDSWPEVVSSFLHELFELALTDVNARYTLCPDYGNDSAGYNFVMSHSPQFSDAVGRVADVVVEAFPELAKIYIRENKRKKKQRSR